MKNKLFILAAALLLCKSFTFEAGGKQSKTQSDQDVSLQDKIDHFVICGGASKIDSLTKYLDGGIDVNAKNLDGKTALMVAVSFDRTEAIKLLVARGACVHQTNYKGDSALYLCLLGKPPEQWNADTLRVLLRSGRRCTHSETIGLTFQAPEKAVAALRTASWSGAHAQADFLAANIEAVDDERRATVAAVALTSLGILPSHSPINGTILSYVSDYEETPAERALTLQSLKKLEQNSSAMRRIQ